MGYRQSATSITVALIPLRGLSPQQENFCCALRLEAGRCWTDMVKAHVASRGQKPWLSSENLEKSFKGQYFLHSTCVQGLAQKLIANVATARELRRTQKNTGQEITARFPYREKKYQTVIWKKSAIYWTEDHQLHLSNARGTPPLILDVPQAYETQKICKAELAWRADHYELCLSMDTGVVDPEPHEVQRVAGVDLGEVHIGAVATESGDCLLESGRALRSVKQLRNKRRKAYDQRLARCKQGSKRHRRLLKNRTRAGAKCCRQQRDILHKASRHVVEFCAAHEVDQIAVGDVRDIQDEVDLGKKTNQKISQWAHGKFVGYLTYKSKKYGMTVAQIPEDYSTRTCSNCQSVRNHAPKGRVYTCPGCGAVIHRDLNGACNICSRSKYGSYGYVQVATQMYLRPLRRSRAFGTGRGMQNSPLTLANARTPRL